MFKKSFVLKGFSEDYVHYLAKRIERGPVDGSEPSRGAAIMRSGELGCVVYPEIEQQLLLVQLSHPKGRKK